MKGIVFTEFLEMVDDAFSPEMTEQILADAERIYQQTVVTRVMPIGNLTGMTEDERQVIAGWYRGLEETQ